MNYFLNRRQSLARNLKGSPEAALITSPVNVTYLTGFTGDGSYVVVTPRTSVLVSDPRFDVQISEECPGVGTSELDLHVRNPARTVQEAAAEVITKLGVKSVAVEGNRIAVSDLEFISSHAPKASFVSQTEMVEALRVIKDMGEIEKIREAVAVAERAYKMFTATMAPTDTEKEMVDALDGYLRRAGARGSAFPTIVAVGERGALPHAPPTNRTLESASKVLIDWGADLLYKSDLTRVFRHPFGTTPTRKNKNERTLVALEEVYEAVLEAQEAAINAIRPGVKAKDVDAAARAVLAGAKVRSDPKLKLVDHFTHGLGHGIGLEIHEAPRLRPNSEDVLEAGMVVTIEPGVYIPGWGGVRIEDDVLVTRGGCKVLSSLSRELPAKD
jgi:Xaa-Pro aminopeptidase